SKEPAARSPSPHASRRVAVSSASVAPPGRDTLYPRSVGSDSGSRGNPRSQPRHLIAQDRTMLWLIRHGETEWSLSGAHTGKTDIPLTAAGEEKARALRGKLADRTFSLVLTSPLQRARRTCELAGYGAQAQIEPNLLEWNYGRY